MVGGTAGPWPLVGRSEELALLRDEVAGARPAVVVAGDVGVGKSRLLIEWLAGLEAEGRPTVVVRATRATATIPFGAFARWAPEGRPGGAADRLGTMRAIAARLAELGEGLAVAVDDAQLLDDGSAALVLHLAEATPTALLVAVRSGQPCPDAVVALWKERLATRLDVQALSEAQVGELLACVLDGPVAPGTQRRLWHLTAGNPLYLREVVEAAVAGGALVRVDGAWRWDGGLPGRTRLAELVSDRIGDCSAAERRMLELLALGEPLPVDVVSRLADAGTLEGLEARRLVAVDRTDTRPDAAVARLAHPLYAEVLRSELPAFTSRSHHRTLVAAVAGTPFERRRPLQVATWVLEAGDGAGRAALLLRASLVALMTDDYALSARLAGASARAGGGWPATLRQAEALGPLRRWDEADALLDGLSVADDPEARAAAARVRAEQAFRHRHRPASEARRIVADAAATVPAAARPSLLVHGARYALTDLDVDEGMRLATEAVAAAGTVEDRLGGTGCVALAEVFAGRTGAALATARAAGAEALRSVERAPIGAGYVAFAYSFASFLDGRVDEAVAVFDAYRGQGVARLAGTPRAMAAMWSARAVLAQGRAATAAGLAREAFALFGDDDPFGRGVWAAGALAAAAAQSGDGGTAASAVAWADARRHPGARTDELLLDLGRTWALAQQGELTAARHLAASVAERGRAAGAPMFEVLGLLDVVRLGGAPTAADRLDELAGVVEGRLVAVVVRFARASADGDGAALDDVAAGFAELGALLLAAEAAATAAVAHGAAGLRRSAAASRAAARALADRCEGARTPLLASLGDVPLARTLTPREREVAGLAARGRTSRQIAASLSISARTVDSHLHHAYTKLGITDRAALAAALGLAGGT